MAPKPKQIAASSSAATAPTTLGSSSQEAPIFGKWNDFCHWDYEEALSL